MTHLSFGMNFEKAEAFPYEVGPQTLMLIVSCKEANATLHLHGDPQDIAQKIVDALSPIAYPRLDIAGYQAAGDHGFIGSYAEWRASGAGVAWTGEKAPTEA